MNHFPKTKIVFFHRSCNQSGAVRQLLTLYRGIDRTAFDPILVILRPDRLFYKDLTNDPHVHILNDKPEPFLISLIRFIRFLRSVSPDIVQSFDPTGNLMIYLASFFYRRPKYFSSVRNTNQKFRYNLMERLFQSRVIQLVVNSVKTREELTVNAGVAKDKIVIIHNGIDSQRFVPIHENERAVLKKQNGIDANVFVFSAVGRIHKQKNPIVIINALTELKNLKKNLQFKFFFIGRKQDQDLYNFLQELIQKNRLNSHIDFIEPTHNIADYYHISDIVILASLWEGLPNVALEAMSCSRVVLVSDQADNDEIIHDGVNGFKFNALSSRNLAEKISLIMNLPVSDLIKIKEKARESVIHRFSVASMIHRYEALYQSCLHPGCLHPDQNSTTRNYIST